LKGIVKESELNWESFKKEQIQSIKNADKKEFSEFNKNLDM
jgi:hypothetical protein